MDTIKVTVLPNGIIRVETDMVSGLNHMNAESFMRDIIKVGGGRVERRAKNTHGHTHSHAGVEHTH